MTRGSREPFFILDDDNHVVPADTMTWARFFEDDRRHIGWTQVTSECLVSTVFLGIDHQFGEGPPIVFETMIFGGPLDQSQWRYSSYDDAKIGHDGVVRLARKALKQRA